MQYRIELREGSCIYVNGAHKLTDELAKYKTEEVEDVRRIRGKFTSETVMDIYGKFIGKKGK